MSGHVIGGKGIEMSSTAIVSFIPALSSSGSGCDPPIGWSKA